MKMAVPRFVSPWFQKAVVQTPYVRQRVQRIANVQRVLTAVMPVCVTFRRSHPVERQPITMLVPLWILPALLKVVSVRPNQSAEVSSALRIVREVLVMKTEPFVSHWQETGIPPLLVARPPEHHRQRFVSQLVLSIAIVLREPTAV
jgi:hypothetical protein